MIDPPPPSPTPISRGRATLVILLLIAIVAGHGYDIVIGREHWPVSHYPMYSLPVFTTRDTSALANYVRQFSAAGLLLKDDGSLAPLRAVPGRLMSAVMGRRMSSPPAQAGRPPRVVRYVLEGVVKNPRGGPKTVGITGGYLPSLTTARIHNILAVTLRHGGGRAKAKLGQIVADYHAIYEAARVLGQHGGPQLAGVRALELRWKLDDDNGPRGKPDASRLLATDEPDPEPVQAPGPAAPDDDDDEPAATLPASASPDAGATKIADAPRVSPTKLRVRTASLVIGLVGILLLAAALVPIFRRPLRRGVVELFAAGDARALAALRIALMLLMFGFFVRYDFSDFANLPDSFRRPLPSFDLLRLQILPYRWLGNVEFVWKVSLLTAAIGLFTRTSLLVAVTLGYYLLALPNQFGKVGHGDGVLLFAMLVLLFSRCGDAWSVDARLRKSPASLRGRDYFWPIQLVRVLTAIIFFAAGYAKLANTGWDWVFSDNLAILLRQHHISAEPILDWGLWFAKRPWLCELMAAGTIAVELLFPLALFSRKARAVLVPSMFAMQVGIALVMGVVFEQFMYVYLFWLPINGWIDRRRSEPQMNTDAHG